LKQFDVAFDVQMTENNQNGTRSSDKNSRHTTNRIISRESIERPRLVQQTSIDESIHEEDESRDNDNNTTDAFQTKSHPLICDDIHFQFNTMQLKSIKTFKK
jgi:hypothetical protein